ncbi:MAG: DUF5011 domain-containing protein [Sphingobacteriales bacterium]|jgi:hypothetical protein|nr:DUF5011 domain-containing protein [Sphingobacteriales bacterium]MBK8679840.1 DUF5011 domain-containing protein [Sphingobacteriales bacterium]MBP9141173.1 DUF5011 domain-containing protein [Chitinophagales bacterium]MDA0198151.1 DUF5011 domain-containing protein [Bacteroidota bacterium]
MLRYLLTMFAVCLSTLAFAQKTAKVPVCAPSTQPKMEWTQETTCGNEVDLSTPPSIKGKKSSTAKSGAAVKIGESTYDLQTNSSVCRRVLVDGDGNVHAMWTMSKSYDVASADRGTGYNMMSSGGTWGAVPDERLEGSQRTGWPNIGLTASGRLFSITHTPDKGAYMSYQDPGGTWKFKVIGTEVGDETGVWPRVAVSGDNIYVIIGRQEGACSGVPTGICYYRSTDAGDTWEKLDNIDLAAYVNDLSADDYAIDARDKNVAIVVGGYASQTVLLKSTDSGDTWNYTVVTPTSNPLIPSIDAPAEETLDPVAVGGGEFTIVLDSKGTAHIAFDRLYCYKDVTDAAGGPYYLPNSAAIMYWNEGMAKAEVIGKTVRQDYDGDGTTSVNTQQVQIQSYGSIVGHTSMGIDASDNLYIAYSAARDGNYETPPGDNSAGRLYRDVYLVKRNITDAGWVGPLNVSDNDNKEDVFPTIAKEVNGTVHLTWQQDDLTGTALQNTNNQGHATFVMNDILYAGVNVDDIKDPSAEVSTKPEFFMTGGTPYGLKNCPVSCDRFGGLSVLDYPDGELTCNQITIGGTVDLSKPNATGEGYHWLLTATDSDGTTSELTFEDADGNEINVIVFDDTTAPLILAGPIDTIDGTIYSYFEYYDSMKVVKGTSYDEPGAIVYDFFETDNGFSPSWIFGCGEGTLTITGTVDVNTAGDYTITYNGEDMNGNQADPIIRLVTVIDKDVDAPAITLFTGKSGVDSLAACGADFVIEIQPGGTWEDPGYIAIDNVDGFVEVVIGGQVPNLEVPGSYTITYTATDKAGNKFECSRVVKVADTQAPTITLSGPGTIIWPCNVPYTDPGYSAFDNIDGDITQYVILSGKVCYTCSGTYTITYSVTDAAGNTATVTRNVIIPDGCTNCSEPELECVEFGTGIDNHNTLPQNSISIYPMPVSNTLNVQFNTMVGNISLDLYDAAGKVVTSIYGNTAVNKVLTIDLSNQPAGVYFVSATSSQGNTTQKVVVTK